MKNAQDSQHSLYGKWSLKAEFFSFVVVLQGNEHCDTPFFICAIYS